MTLSLNIDLGETADEPVELYELATLVNIACGGHAGDAESMRRACSLAARGGARLVGHPSYPDRVGFGRVSMNLRGEALRQTVSEQLRALGAIAQESAQSLVGVKAHGALYHDANAREEVARALMDAVDETLDGTVAVVGAPEGALYEEARRRGCPYWREGFADRAYGTDGRLLPRSLPGAVLDDESLVRAQAQRLLQSGRFDTLCVHGDTPGAVAWARAVRELLDAHGARE